MSEPITDLSAFAEPKSDQINADDLIGGPRTVTIEAVVRGPDEQQAVEIRLLEAKPYRPCKSMRRVLIAAWGADPREWPVPARMTLFRDPAVKFGGVDVGGIRISHLSGLDEPLHIPLTTTRAKRARYTVMPLPPATDPLTEALKAANLTVEQLDAWGAANGQPLAATLDAHGRQAAAQWLAGGGSVAVEEFVRGGKE